MSHNKPCKYFMTDKCTTTDCKFIHDANLCKHHYQNKCKFTICLCSTLSRTSFLPEWIINHSTHTAYFHTQTYFICHYATQQCPLCRHDGRCRRGSRRGRWRSTRPSTRGWRTSSPTCPSTRPSCRRTSRWRCSTF